MWLVADDDTKIYILGTMHALPRGPDWDAGRVASAIKAADELRMELSPADLAAAGELSRKLAPPHAPLALEARPPGQALTGFRALTSERPRVGVEGCQTG